MKFTNLTIITFLLFLGCAENVQKKEAPAEELPSPVAFSLSGNAFYAKPAPEALSKKLQNYKEAYEKDPENVDNHIWYGRFIAYTTDYPHAIEFYSKSIEKFPKDARLYRHRAHRYISTRDFDAAIADMKVAESLIEGTENEIEPDGMPNAQNIPVSTLHGNIWYHMGLAYYLKNDMPNALAAYERCRDSWSNDDNKVSSTHWIYMILRRMGEQEKANAALDAITQEMNIIENFAYHDLCLFYKGEKSLEDLSKKDGDNQPGNDAVDYGIGNWHLYNGDEEKAEKIFKQILERDSWNSFGYIAAEADMHRGLN